MKRILSIVASLALIASATLLPFSASLGAGVDPAGKYDQVKPPQPTDTPDKVEVVEVFSYACPHCFSFLPYMEKYARSKPDYVAIRHMPAVFRNSWVAPARAFYTAQVLGIEKEMHRAIFEAIHVDKKPMETREDVMSFFESRGVSNADFNKAYDSFAVETLMRKSQVMQQRYGIRGTPSVIVNGKYRVSGTLAGTPEGVLQVTDALAEREHAEMTQ
jgi:thiol:disulfide interchange protein DsbA